jgi:hypothetical protein
MRKPSREKGIDVSSSSKDGRFWDRRHGRGTGLLALWLGVPGERRVEKAKPVGFVSWEMYLFICFV